MDLLRRKRALFAKAVDVHVSILNRGDRSDGHMTESEIVPAAGKRAELRSFGPPAANPPSGREGEVSMPIF